MMVLCNDIVITEHDGRRLVRSSAPLDMKQDTTIIENSPLNLYNSYL